MKGKSHMDLVSLVAHGISGIATFSETAATRILMGNVIGLMVLLMGFGCYVVYSLWITRTISEWAAYAAGLALLLFVQMLWITFSLVFSVISNRTAMEFVPIRDYSVFVERLEHLPELA